MAQVTIYLNNNLEAKIKKISKSLGISMSKYISNLIENNLKNEWNPKVKKLSGAWDDFPDLKEIRNYKSPDIKREEL